MHARWKNKVTRNYLLTTHICWPRCPITNAIMEIERRFLFLFIWVHKAKFARLFGLPYKAEKETPFNFHDGISDRAPRLTYVGGQEVVPCNFIFPPCVHILHLGAKIHRVNGNILNINFKVHIYAGNIFTYLLLCFRTGAFGVKA